MFALPSRQCEDSDGAVQSKQLALADYSIRGQRDGHAFRASQHTSADQLGLWREDLCRRKLLSINGPCAARFGACAARVVQKNGLEALVHPAEAERHSFRFVTVPR
jgi:hypothetical protein